jgi:hypothetical protein
VTRRFVPQAVEAHPQDVAANKLLDHYLVAHLQAHGPAEPFRDRAAASSARRPVRDPRFAMVFAAARGANLRFRAGRSDVRMIRLMPVPATRFGRPADRIPQLLKQSHEASAKASCRS